MINNKKVKVSHREMGLVALEKCREIKVAQAMCIKVMNNADENISLRVQAVVVLGDSLSESPNYHGIEKLVKLSKSNVPKTIISYTLDALNGVRESLDDMMDDINDN